MFKLNGQVLLPMNAYQMGKNKSWIEFPAFGQPKLDGNRCLAFMVGKQVLLISRSGKLISHLDGIRDEIRKILGTGTGTGIGNGLYLDGELHIDDEKDIGMLRRVLGRKNGTRVDKELEKRIKFYIFDGFQAGKLGAGFEKRWAVVKKAVGVAKTKDEGKGQLVRLVPTFVIKKESDVDSMFKKMLNEGYEGLVLRNREGGGYLLGGKRTRDVITSKSFGRGEFKVSGFKEGLGKNAGTIVFKLRCLRSGGNFWARPMGSIEQRGEMFRRGVELVGRKVNVKYIEMDDKTGCVVRNPVVTGLR